MSGSWDMVCDVWMGGQKKLHIEVGVPPKKDKEYWNCICKIKNGQNEILSISDQILSDQNI